MPERPKKSVPRFSAAARSRLAEALARKGLATGPKTSREGRIEPGPRPPDGSPLSSPQQRVWIAEQWVGPSPLYHVPLAAHLSGALDLGALERALADLMVRHEVLRSRLVVRDGTPRIVPQPVPEKALAHHEIAGVERRHGYARALEEARAAFVRPFDLGAEGPLRADLWTLGPDEHLLLLTVHHIACDGATIGILWRELGELYDARRTRRPHALGEPGLQYADFAHWERAQQDDEEVRQALEWWSERLDGAPEPTALPSERSSPSTWSPAGAWHVLELGDEVRRAVETLASAHRATAFQVFLAAFHALIFRLTRADELLVGLPVTLRDRPELENLPGFLVNTVALRTSVQGSLRFVELLERVQENALEAVAQRAAPFERVLEALRHRGRTVDAGRPAVRLMFDHRAQPPRSGTLGTALGARLLTEDELHSGTSKVDLALYTELDASGARVSAEYSTDLHDAASIERLLERFRNLLLAAARDPYARLTELPVLLPGERETLASFASGPEDPRPAQTIPQAVARIAAEEPARVAVVHGESSVTYGQLVERARGLARHLVARGGTRGEPIALCLSRSDDLVVAMLAVLEVGAPYLPLDPNYPPERLAFMLRDSGARLLVTESLRLEAVPEEARPASTLVLDRERLPGTSEPWTPPPTSADDPAYLIYTSGSTGLPKGVACPHRGVLRLFHGSRWLRFDPPVRMVHLAPESFDASVLDLWGPLVTGGTVILHPERNPTLAGLARVVEEHDVDTLFLTTALFHALVDESPATLSRLRQVATGGEALSAVHLARARELCPDLAIANCYGPTEATVIATTWEAPVGAAPQGAPPIGRPITDTRAHVLDPDRLPVPPGVPGELFVGGPAIALGYWRRPELTAERFVEDPFGPGRLYRTGDRARWRADGTLEFLGRTDDQVKIRGHRIEPAEIEARLGEHSGVRSALVVAREDTPGVRRLVAYVVPTQVRPTAAELASHLATRLPEYLRPAEFVFLEELPLTPGGKVDRARLPAPESPADEPRPAPMGAVEEILAGLWCELLGVPRVGRDDDFFALGGHSLSGTVLFARIARQLGVELPLTTLFESRTLAGLARAVEAAGSEAHLPAPIPRRPDPLAPAPLSHNQRGLWFLQQMAPRSPFYNVPFAVPLRGELDECALERALELVTLRHEALRTTFPFGDGEPVQVVGTAPIGLERVDLSAVQESEREESLRVALEAFAREPFDLERGPLARALLARTTPDEAVLAFNVHHIVFDGWSLDVLLRDLRTAYQAACQGREPDWEELAVQPADLTCHLRSTEAQASATADLAFWKEELEGAPLVLELATDHPRPATPTWRGGRVQRTLPRDLTERLATLARSHGATPYLALLALTETLLGRYAGTQDLIVGTPVAGRRRAETQDLIGLQLNVLAIRADLTGAPSFLELLERTRERVLRAQAHQELPFERLVDALKVRRDPATTPIHQVLFSLRHEPRGFQSGAVAFDPPFEIDAAGAKTDLAITIEERDHGDWLLDLCFARDLFEPETLERFGEHFENLLRAALESPTTPVQTLEFLGTAERTTLVETWSGPSADYPHAESLTELFQRVVDRSRDAVALVHEDRTVTYGALAMRSHRLARHLVSLGVQRGARVGLCVERSPTMIAGLLAILEAGGAYVPLDPSYPAERLAYMLADAGVEVLLVDEHLIEDLPETRATVVVLQEIEAFLEREATRLGSEDRPMEVGATGDDLAYVMYTSGSTGRPKGVKIPQHAISRLIFGANYARLDATRTLLQLAPISFDAATLEIWGALLTGARLVLYPDRVPTAAALDHVLKENQVTTLWLTAALFNAVVDERPGALSELDECLTGGEALSVAHVQRAHEHLPPTVQLINGYGPTENTTFTCCYRIPRDLDPDESSISIGRPITNTKVFVVDHNLRLVPIGVPGELVTGGEGLALGYLGRPELDARRFVPNPFGPGRLYRTGDRVRWRSDGRLEFLGRTDDQVKIRGHRIEPGEVAAMLGSHPRVRKAFASVHDSPQTGKVLVAYLEYSDGPGVVPASEELAGWLSERLPSYMVPASFMVLEALPMNPNGKVDRKRLPPPEFHSKADQKPRNELEHHLAGLWSKVLGAPEVGPADDFFELGGHSLLAVKLVQEIQDAFGQELELSSLISAPTLAEQAQLLHQGVGTARSNPLVKLQPTGSRTPVFCVCSLGGTVLNQRPLAVALGPEQPFFGLQAVDLEPRLGRAATISDYAATYIEAMKTVAPQGPYVIGGHSFGGIVSFEVAQQLTARGDEVAMLFILDSSLPNLDKSALDRMACMFAFLRGLPYLPVEAWTQLRRDPDRLARTLKQKLRFVRGKARPAGSPPPAPPVAAAPEQDPGSMRVADVVEMSSWPENNRRIAQRHWNAVLQYRPKAYPGRITLFRSRFQSPFLGLGNQMGWERVALGGVDVVRVPGGHLSVLQSPNVEVLARRLRERLGRSRASAA
jgi:amino acid adenylation domain-containing protein